MDIKRLEGTTLNETILNSQAPEISKETENLAIAIKTTVSQALLGALSDELSSQGFIEATVEDVKPNAYKLMLNNGVEIEVNAQTNIALKKNDILKLMISSLNPLVLKIADVKSPSSPIVFLQQSLENNTKFSVDNFSPKDIENSGLFYEKKLMDVLLKAKDMSSVLNDQKYQLLKDIVSTSKDLKSIEAFKNLENDIKTAIEHLAEGNITPKDLETILKEPQPQIQDINDILNLLLNQEPQPQTLPTQTLNQLQNVLSNMEKNAIFNAKEIPKLVQELSNIIQNMPDNIKDAFFKSPQNILDSLKNQTFVNPAKIVELSKHVKEAINTLQSNTNFDTKLNHLKDMSNTLLNINTAQQFILQNNAFFVNFKEQGDKTSLSHKKAFGAFKKEENTYKAFIKLNWEDGFLGGILEMPKNNHAKLKEITIRFYTDIEPLSKALESSKSELEAMLKEESLNLRAFEVFKTKAQEFDLEVVKNVADNSNLNIFT